jgi:hypothetical protein
VTTWRKLPLVGNFSSKLSILRTGFLRAGEKPKNTKKERLQCFTDRCIITSDEARMGL